MDGVCKYSGEPKIQDLLANKGTALASACVLALCWRWRLFWQAARSVAAIVHRRQHCLLAAFGSTWSEKSCKFVEISWSINRSSLRASVVHNVQVMLLVDSSAVKARARCLSRSANTFRAFALALRVSYGRTESRLCMGAAGGCCPDYTEEPQRCCYTFP
jgi:hypothetical protein